MPSLAQWASRLYAFIVGTLMLSVGIVVFLAPKTPSQNLFSFPLTSLGSSTSPSPTLYLFASRETSLGLVILTLLFTRQYRSLGFVFTCLFISGATDAYLEVAYGHGSWADAAKVHLPFAVLGAPSIMALMGERGKSAGRTDEGRRQGESIVERPRVADCKLRALVSLHRCP